MSITDYFTITCSLILMWSFGRLFTQSVVMSTLLLGLLVASGIIAIIARFMPGYTGALLYTFSLLGIIKLVYDAYRHYVNHGMKGCQDIIQRHATPTSLLTTIGYLLFFALYFQSFHYSNVHYEAHDVLYFGPSFEMLKADYLGNLRVPVFYPYELGAYHLLPAAMITAGGFLTHHPTLQYLTEVRYFLAILFFSDFFRRFYNTLNCKLHWYIAISMASLIIFGPAISQCLTISSFCYVFVLLSILITIFELQQPAHRQSISHQKLLLIFSILLIICKAPLFYIAGIFAFFLWIKLKPHRWRWQVVLTAAIVLGNMSTWVLIPPSYLVKQNAASFHLVHNRTDATALATVTAWFTPPTLYVNLTNNINEHITNTAIVKKEIEKIRDNGNTELAHNIETTFIPAVFFLIYIITSIYALFFYIASRKKKRDLYDNALILYMLTSLVGWLFVRNGPHQIDQQVHAFLLASTITAVMLIQYISPIKYATTKLGQIAVGLLCLYGFHITLHPLNTSLANNEAKSLTIATARRQSTPAPFYTPKENEPYWKIELQALMSGLRVEANNHILPFGHVQLPTFTLHLTRLQMCSLKAYQSDHNMCPS